MMVVASLTLRVTAAAAAREINGKIRQSLIGRDPMRVSSPSPVVQMALLDLRAKFEGCPIYELLGGAKRTRVETYASLLQYSGAVEHVKRNTARALDNQRNFFLYKGPRAPPDSRRRDGLVALLRADSPELRSAMRS